MKLEELVDKLKLEILENDSRGTVQDFCDILDTDDETAVSMALAILQADNLVELLETKIRFREDGGAINEGVFGISSEALVNKAMREIEKIDNKRLSGYKLSDQRTAKEKELKEVRRLFRKKIISAVCNARTK